MDNKNLTTNFPVIKRWISLSAAIEIFGENYVKILRLVNNMNDTFGLCGLLAGHAGGILTNPVYWKDIYYHPKSLMVNATKHQITPLGLFIDKYYRGDKSTRARDIRIHNTLEIVVTLDALLPRQCLLIAVLCTTYPLHGNGIYTHYLNARLMGNENILLTGDLTPFGIFGFASIEVTPNILGQATNKVINARATINNVAKIAVAEKAESRQSNVTNGLFQTNACIWNGL